jgi:SET domain-containing protein
MNVYAGDSTISNVGKGLFAARDLLQDELIVEYLGELLSPDEQPRNSRSNLYFDDGYTLCCHDDDLASFANDCINPPVESRKIIKSLRKYEPFYKRHTNATINAEIHLDQDSHKAFLYSRSPIKKDQEIFCHYGFLYWFNHEAFNLGFELEKEIERNGFPDDIFKYAGFHAYVKEFYPSSKEIEVSQSASGYVVAIKFENNKGMILNMPRLSQFFDNFKKA